ncbi:MAG: hypothetical protein IH953_00550 [Chloroflexi bacterium]|nr:hypothetical protein [Chloroflexota bacterium]
MSPENPAIDREVYDEGVSTALMLAGDGRTTPFQAVVSSSATFVPFQPQHIFAPSLATDATPAPTLEGSSQAVWWESVALRHKGMFAISTLLLAGGIADLVLGLVGLPSLWHWFPDALLIVGAIGLLGTSTLAAIDASQTHTDR